MPKFKGPMKATSDDTISELRALLLSNIQSIEPPLHYSFDNLKYTRGWRTTRIGLTNMLVSSGATDLHIKRIANWKTGSGLARIVRLMTAISPKAAIYCALEIYQETLPKALITEFENTNIPMGMLLKKAACPVSYKIVEAFRVVQVAEDERWGNGRSLLILNRDNVVVALSVEMLNGSAQSILSPQHYRATNSC